MKKILKSPISWGILAGLLLFLPTVNSYQFIGSDCTHVGLLEGLIQYPGMSPLNLYNFSDGTPEHVSELISEGFNPWYTNLTWKMKFCRHVPSVLLALNHKIAGLNPQGYVLHSLLWYLILIVLMGFLVRMLVPASVLGSSHPVAYIALFIFALAQRNGFVVLYGGARWLLIAMAFALAGLVAHIKWREQGWKPGRYLSLVCFLLALLSGEASMAVLAYLAAYELAGSAEPLKKRINALIPITVLVFIYLMLHRILGYGAGGEGTYTHPLNEPVEFLSALPFKLSAMLGELFFGTMSLFGIYPVTPGHRLLSLGAAAAVLVIGGLLLYPSWSKAPERMRRTVNWLILGTVGAMVPLASVQAAPRVVLILSIGGSVLMAVMIHYWFQRIWRNPLSFAWIGTVFCMGLIFLHLIYSPYLLRFREKGFNQYMEEWNRFQENTILNDLQPHRKAIFLNGAGGDGDPVFSGFYHRKINRMPMPESWWQLSWPNLKQRYIRTAENTLELEILEGCLYDSLYTQEGKNRKVPLKKGEVISLQGLQITVLEVNETGPTRIEFKFDRSLDDKDYCFFRCRKDYRLKRVKPPGVGRSMTFR
ncbi:MAG: hypothetical protein GY940_14895 [bacterium]|nr:hypothetical protein [bacterium]